MVTASNKPTKTSLVDEGIEQQQNWAGPNGVQRQSQTCLWQFARHTGSRVTHADTAGAHYNTKAWRCVHRSKQGDGMVQDWPSPKKGT